MLTTLAMAAHAAAKVSALPQVQRFWPSCGFSLSYIVSDGHWSYELSDDVHPSLW